MMDFIREMFPFLYTISISKLLVGAIIAVFILGLIATKDIAMAFGFIILGAIVYALLYFFLDGVGFVDVLAITLFAVLVIIVIGLISSIITAMKNKAKEKEKAERERQEKICPQCGAEDAVHPLKNEDVWKPYVFKGMKTDKDGRRMEYFQRTVDRIKGCNQCDYRAVFRSNTYDYDVKEMADDGYCCPKCNTKDAVYLKEVVVKDRYASNKEVEETTSRGSKTRYVKVMKILEEETYACRNCDFTSIASVTKELD